MIFLPKLGCLLPIAAAITLFSQANSFTPAQYPLSSSPSKVGSCSSSLTVKEPKTTLTTRLGTNKDVNLLALWLAEKNHFHSEYNGEIPNQLKFKTGDAIQSLIPNLRNAQVIFLQSPHSTRQEDVIGFASYNIQYTSMDDPPIFFLNDIFIGKNNRAQGAGNFFMKELASIAKKTFCSHMTWVVDPRNARAVKFYNQLDGGVKTTTMNGSSSSHRNRIEWVPEFWGKN